MRLKEIFIVTRGTRVILAVTLSVSLLGLSFAFFYYSSVNRSEDPRIEKARGYLQVYERNAAKAGNQDAFLYLDSALFVFRSLPDYESSFETGVVYNNKCSVLLLSALYDSLIDRGIKDHLLSLSMKYCDSSITVYKRWIAYWGQLGEEEIRSNISPFMKAGDPSFKGYNFERILNRRIKNIKLAQVETPRRLSVSYSNKAIIFRHLMLTDSSVIYYKNALSLWKDNRAAESNLSVLLGGNPVEPTLIEKLFPPDRKKK